MRLTTTAGFTCLSLPLVVSLALTGGCFSAGDDADPLAEDTGSEDEVGEDTTTGTEAGTDDTTAESTEDTTADDTTESTEDTTDGRGSFCGDGVKDPGEECDGDDLGGASCADFGFDSGQLSCAPNCTYVTSECSDEPLEFVSITYHTSGNNTSMATIIGACQGQGAATCDVVGPQDGGWDALEIGCNFLCPHGAQATFHCDTGGQSNRTIEDIDVSGADPQSKNCNNTDCDAVFTVVSPMDVDCSITD